MPKTEQSPIDILTGDLDSNLQAIQERIDKTDKDFIGDDGKLLILS